MAKRTSHRRRSLPDTLWAWCIFAALLVGTAGWFWLLGHDLHIGRKKEPASPTTAKSSH